MSLLGIGSVIESVGKVASDLITTDKEKMQLNLEGRKLDMAIDLAQMEVNKVEAAGGWFRGGWRPATGWVCAAALAYTYILQPFMVFGLTAAGVDLPPLPSLATGELMPILLGMLGLGAMRSVEKTKGLK